MITLRNGATAFLENNGRMLLLKRAQTKKISPGVWSGVGGHMEPDEINDPYAACLREINEETGIATDDIVEMTLRYVITRRSKDEIRQSYIYFGKTTQTQLVQSDEGQLHWIAKEELMQRTFSQTFTEMLKHYTLHEVEKETIYLGIAQNNEGRLHMHWSRIEDFE